MSLSFRDAMFWTAIASCIVAQVAIVRSVVTSPRRGAVELVWAVLPALALGLVFALTWRRLHP